MKQILVPCDTCKGEGKTPLPEHLRETLALVGKRGKTAYDIHRESDEGSFTTPNAFNNRLEKLRALGLVVRHREGKFYLYSKPVARIGSANRP